MPEPTGATPTGVPTVDLNDPSVKLSRADAMKQMRASRHNTLVEEIGEQFTAEAAPNEPKAQPGAAVDEDTDAGDAIAAEARKKYEAEAEADLDPAAQVAVTTRAKTPVVIDDADLANYQVRTKVNGVEQLVPLDQVRTSAQKTDSADKYLAEAKTLLSEVHATIREQKAAPAAPVDGAELGTAAPDTTSQGPDPIEAAIDSLFTGDDKQAKAMLRKAIDEAHKRGPQEGDNADSVATKVEQRIVIRSALRQFAKDHKKIAADPTLRRVADTFLMEETGNRRLEDFSADQIPDLLERAGTRTMEWIKSVSGVAPARGVPATTQSEKLAAKATIDELPTASVRSSSTVPEPRTPSQVIDGMKRARGQLVEPAG